MPDSINACQTNFNTEIVMLILGAVLGLMASIITMIAQRWLDRKGKLNIFYRFCYQKNGKGQSWCFEDGADGQKFFTVPVVFEFQNTSNTTRVIRDVSLLLYNGKDLVAKMIQLDHLHTTKRKGSEITEEKDLYFGTDKGSYSFVIEPRSIQRQECEYMHIISRSDILENTFDTIILRYYDERNCAKSYTIRKIDGNWERQNFDVDEE